MAKIDIWTAQNGSRSADLALKNNYEATTNPGVGDDSDDGYQVGSTWTNTLTKAVYVCTSAAIGAATWALATQGAALGLQAAVVAKTTSVTLTAAELIGTLPAGGIITGNQGAGAGAAYTLPLATDLDAALLALFPSLANQSYFDFTVINLSTVAAEDITITTNTGWTLVGSMIVIENAAGSAGISSARFRAVRTSATAYVLYRLG